MKTGIYTVWVTTETGQVFKGLIEASSLAECIQLVINRFGPNVRKTIVTPSHYETKQRRVA